MERKCSINMSYDDRADDGDIQRIGHSEKNQKQACLEEFRLLKL